MALFFDAGWFVKRLQELGLTPQTLAAALGWSDEDLRLAFKDQREIRSSEVQIMAALLGETPQTIATRCGVSTPLPPQTDAPDGDLDPGASDSGALSLAELFRRVEQLEWQVGALQRQLDQARRP